MSRQVKLFVLTFVFSIFASCGKKDSNDTPAPPEDTPVAPAPAPVAPGKTAYLITSSGDGKITLNWSAVDNATKYTIYWNTTGNVSDSNGSGIGDVTDTTYTHQGLNNGTPYYYRVVAFNQGVAGAASDQAGDVPKGTIFKGLPYSMIGFRDMPAIHVGQFYNDGTTYYAATSGGLAISRDSGTSWQTRTTTNGMQSNFVQKFIFTNNGSTLLVGTWCGVSKSVDGGVSFSTINVSGSSACVEDLTSATINGVEFIYVATIDGLYVSSNGGNSFTQLLTGSVMSLKVDSGTIYAGTSDGVQVSTNNGSSFQKYLSGKYVNAFAGEGNWFFAAAADGFYHSNGGGITNLVAANKRTAVPSNSINQILFTSNTLYVGTNAGLGISSDFGVTFSNKAKNEGISVPYVMGVRLDKGTLFACGFGGIFSSTDGGGSFSKLAASHSGLGVGLVNDIAGDGTKIYAATANGLSISTDGGASFTTKGYSNGLLNYSVNAVAVNGSNIYLATTYGLAISTDGGATFTNKTTPFGTDTNLSSVAIVGSKIFVGSEGSNIYISSDGGNSFSSAALGTSYQTVNCIVALDSNNIFACTGGAGLAKSTNGGGSWTMLTTTQGLGSNSVNALAISGTTLYAGTQGGVSISTDGTNFTNAVVDTQNGGIYPESIAVSGSTIFAGTSVGIYTKTGTNPYTRKYTSADGLTGNYVNRMKFMGTKLFAGSIGGLAAAENP